MWSLGPGPRFRVILATLLAVLALALLGCEAVSGLVNAKATAKVGSAAPDFSLPHLQNLQAGARLSLQSYKGQPVIVNFWATWCAPCRAEFPALEDKYRQYKDSLGLVVLAVQVREDSGAAAAQRFVDQMGATFPVVLDSDGRAAESYAVKGLPTSVFIDRAGVVQDIVIGGPLTEEYIEKQLVKIR